MDDGNPFSIQTLFESVNIYINNDQGDIEWRLTQDPALIAHGERWIGTFAIYRQDTFIKKIFINPLL
jgi:hypothetical protein